jgi:hypothetical protein
MTIAVDKASTTAYENVSDMRAIGESEGYWRAEEQLLGTLRTARNSREIRQNTRTINTIIVIIEHFI